MSEWKECKLGDELELLYGKGLKENERMIGHIPVYGSNGIVGYHNEALVKGPGIIIGRKGSVGEVKFSAQDYFPIDTTYYVRLKNENDIKFFYYFLSNIQLNEMNSHSAVPGLNRNDVYSIDAKIPYPTEQRTIAAILSSLDNKIDLLHRQNKTLEQLAETLFRQWFPPSSRNAGLRRAGVEEADESWEVGTLEDEFDFTMGQSPPGDSYNEVGNGTIFFQGRTDFDFRFPKTRMFTTKPSRFAKQFDTLISVRAPVGDMNMAYEGCCIGRGLSAFRYKNNESYYTYSYYKLRSLMQQIRQFEDSGTVFGSITKDDFKRFENVIPSFDLIGKFQVAAKPIDEKIFSNTNQIRTLAQLRDTLLPKLMSGEVRVKMSESEFSGFKN